MVKEVKKIAFEIISKENEYCDDYSLASGKAGISLFLYNAGLYTENEVLIEKASQYFQECLYRSHEERDDFNHALYGGTTGTYWLFQYFINVGFIDEEEYEDVLLSYDAVLMKTCKYWADHQNYDLLYGLLGASVYYFERHKTTDALHHLEEIASMLISFSNCSGNMRWWYDKESMNNSKKEHVVNVGFAHGLPSLISFFSEMYSISKSEIYLRITTEIYNYLIDSCSQSYIDLGSFPYQVIDNIAQPDYSRLAWCYGDLTIGYSLLSSGQKLGHYEMQKLGEEILKGVLERKMDDKKTGVLDSCFCHGISGIIYVLKCAEKLLGSDIFSYCIKYWEAELLEFKSLNDGYPTIFFNRVSNEFQSKFDYGYLEGIAGIGLSLLPASQLNFSLINLIK